MDEKPDRTAQVNDARRLAAAVVGPGMATTIRGGVIRAVIEHIDDLEAENAELRAASAKKGTAKAKPEPENDPWLEQLPLAVRSLASIVEENAELWGRPALEALEAFLSQKGTPMSDEFQDAVMLALADLGGETPDEIPAKGSRR